MNLKKSEKIKAKNDKTPQISEVFFPDDVEFVS